MLNPFQPKVHQKLAHTRLLLAMTQECGADLMDRQKSEALLSAAVMSLGVAFTLYLKELAANHQLSGVEQIHTFEQLQYALTAAGKVETAVAELDALMADGWVGELQLAVHQAQYPAPAAPLQGSVQMINAVSAPEFSATEAWLLSSLTAFEQMTDRQRHSNLEY